MTILPFDDRDGFIWLDGNMVPWREAKTHVLTHGLHYGSCIFEGERAYGGKIFKDREHSERFHTSGELLGFTIPYSVDALIKAKAEVLKANNIVDGYLRPVAWRGSEMMAISAQQTKIHVAIAAWVWPSMYKKDIKETGIRLGRADVPAPLPRMRAGGEQGGGAIHDLHHQQARGRAQRVRRCADA